MFVSGTFAIIKKKDKVHFDCFLSDKFKFLKSVLLRIVVIKNRKCIYTGATFIGFVGLIIGVNQKHVISTVSHARNNGIFYNLSIFEIDRWLPGHFIRFLLENNIDTSDTHKRIMKYKFVTSDV